MERVIGIDLGTTNSCAAVVENGRPAVIANRGGYKTTPSMVAVADNGRRMVGHLAKRQAITNPENTVFAAKRLIGRKWSSAPVRQACEASPYKIVSGPHDDVRLELRGQIYSIPEISSFILQEIRLLAEGHLGGPVEKAVITVPAYFNDNQRQATKDAGRIAGLEVIRIINEPTAAALAFGWGKKLGKRVAVYDLGGGTFDISILDVRDDVYEVIATSGDTFLGGEDFDRRLLDRLVADFAKHHKIDLRQDKMAMQRVKDVVEKARCDLSFSPKVEVHLPFITSSPAGPLHLTCDLTRADLDALTRDLVGRTVALCRATLAEAKIDKASIDEVLLVGGMTRMPAVQAAVAEFFGRPPSKGVHPDEVVAMGAAIQGAALVEEKKEMLLLDVTPHSLGIMVAGGYCHRLIEKNTTVPAAKTHTFTTVKDYQTSVKILVLQGESERAEDNELLGEFVVHGLRPAKKGEVEIDVTFEISADGIVSVSTKNLENGAEQAVTVSASSGLTEDEIVRMVEQSKEYALALREEEALERQRQLKDTQP